MILSFIGYQEQELSYCLLDIIILSSYLLKELCSGRLVHNYSPFILHLFHSKHMKCEPRPSCAENNEPFYSQDLQWSHSV